MTQAPPTLGALFGATFWIGLLSFGGGLAGWLHRTFVVRNGWVSDEEFAASLTLAQILPGANVINLVICLGEQLRGPLGAVACVGGFLIGPFFAVIALCALFDALGGLGSMQAVSSGVAFAAVGLLITICWRGVRQVRRRPGALAVIAVTAIAVGVLQLPLVASVAVIVPVSIALAARGR